MVMDDSLFMPKAATGDPVMMTRRIFASLAILYVALVAEISLLVLRIREIGGCGLVGRSKIPYPLLLVEFEVCGSIFSLT
jgi:hypothetical protein